MNGNGELTETENVIFYVSYRVLTEFLRMNVILTYFATGTATATATATDTLCWIPGVRLTHDHDDNSSLFLDLRGVSYRKGAEISSVRSGLRGCMRPQRQRWPYTDTDSLLQCRIWTHTHIHYQLRMYTIVMMMITIVLIKVIYHSPDYEPERPDITELI